MLENDNNIALEADLINDADLAAESLRPALYRVVLYKDDYTPEDFFISILERFFGMPNDYALFITAQIHRDGSAAGGVFSKDVAETKSQQVLEYARAHEHPLLCTIEAV